MTKKDQRQRKTHILELYKRDVQQDYKLTVYITSLFLITDLQKDKSLDRIY